MIKPIRCKTLLGHTNLDFSIECLQSFLRHSCNKIYLEIYEDGSITQEDAEKLLSELKNSTIIKKEERDLKLEQVLANYPACKFYRNSTNYAQKIFDMMLYSDGDVFYIDSDIYFLKKFVLPPMEEMPIFMFDTQNAYSFTPVDLLKINIPVFPNVNTGLFYFPQNLFSIAFVEAMLNDPVIGKGVKKGIPWLEQTIWSFLAAKSRSISYFDRQQIIMADFALKTDADTVAIHLVYYFRTHIKQLRLLPVPDTDACASIGLKIHSSYLDKLDFAFEKLVRKMKRMV